MYMLKLLPKQNLLKGKATQNSPSLASDWSGKLTVNLWKSYSNYYSHIANLSLIALEVLFEWLDYRVFFLLMLIFIALATKLNWCLFFSAWFLLMYNKVLLVGKTPVVVADRQTLEGCRENSVLNWIGGLRKPLFCNASVISFIKTLNKVGPSTVSCGTYPRCNTRPLRLGSFDDNPLVALTLEWVNTIFVIGIRCRRWQLKMWRIHEHKSRYNQV